MLTFVAVSFLHSRSGFAPILLLLSDTREAACCAGGYVATALTALGGAGQDIASAESLAVRAWRIVMFAPRGGPAGNSEGQNSGPKDVVVCERSPLPLVIPRALIEAIWNQVNHGLRPVPPGQTEVGGLFLGSRGQNTSVLPRLWFPSTSSTSSGPPFGCPLPM
jgi:hypothetical protein